MAVKEEVKIVEAKAMRNGYIIDTVTSLDVCEVTKISGKVI